ncbi:hypothetical protein VB711_06160 [Cronbergia sp. UHCC 0137]|uniref:hypothetical protein n=1 Tax=Cronbergia sp. UHCC 0137 TaxID=3110239 RepID=UPI002B21CB0F|nr:hypothetical protein [Cronbergia sp. UHCC 0137]MEA5617422.1 hypothetical protein [Cronbergia sp. UHCC 0137]
MNKTICMGLMMLPVYFYNAGFGFAIHNSWLRMSSGDIISGTDAQLGLLSQRVEARDEQTGDCLRFGTCKD